MGWLFGRKRDSDDANEVLRRYNEAEAARLAVMTAGGSAATTTGQTARFPASDPLSVNTSSTEFTVEDVFTITGRGVVATGSVTSGVLRVDDDIAVLRDGAVQAQTRIVEIEMFRKRANEAKAGELVGLVLRDKVAIARGDVIRAARSA
ncbi:GTPase [Microbacterium phyllosphaerae]|uniref:GTPase n=1 Tax=Microbacterium phyllosphaerae TaxID=124798 RepID=A0ABS4WR24_9MICO|nr:EF-Tu/IF-2/RF-3 family GTPase [Microbacterium phyllosphaerae]MBP2378506.1 GTPase [Microbacterium phyllosphaerae]MCS3441540.1 GTPase [Microbacterium phyllosphaerae]